MRLGRDSQGHERSEPDRQRLTYVPSETMLALRAVLRPSHKDPVRLMSSSQFPTVAVSKDVLKLDCPHLALVWRIEFKLTLSLIMFFVW